MNITEPKEGTYPDYYKNYILKVKGDNIMELLLTEHYETIDLITSIDLETQHYRYANDKWNVKEIIQHLIDSERVFAYRILCFARNEKAHLPAIDQNEYNQASFASLREMNDIAREFSVLRASTIELIKSLNAQMLDNSGTANGKLITVRALIYIILGHEIHHRQVIDEKYLPK